MSDVFVSYSSHDRDRVASLANALEEAGVSVWWDRRLVPGDVYETEIDDALTKARVVLVVWTPASVASQWVRSEADFGRNKGILVPVLLESCETPRPFDRLHTADLRKWKGDKGNQHFPELLEAIRSRIEGRAPSPIKWRKRITLAALGSTTIVAIGLISSLTGIADAIVRYTHGDQYALSTSQKLLPEGASAETQDGFRLVLQQLNKSLDLRTQQALKKLDEGSRAEAVQALTTIAQDQSGALAQQMNDAAILWRQVGLLLFNDDPPRALQALDQARRFRPNDLSILTPLAALYFRAGRSREAEAIYSGINVDQLSPEYRGLALQVLGQGALERGQHQAAEAAFLQALSIAERINDDFMASDLLIDLGRVALERMDVTAALDSFAEAESFADSLPYPRSALYAQLNQIEAFVIDLELDKANELLAKAIAEANLQADSVALATLDLSSARVDLRQGKAARAMAVADAVLTRSKDLQLRYTELQAMMLLAEANLAIGEPAEAGRLARDAEMAWLGLNNESAATIAHSVAEIARIWPLPVAEKRPQCRLLEEASKLAPTPYSQAESRRIQSLGCQTTAERSPM